MKKIKKKLRRAIEWLRLHKEVWKDSNRYYKAASWAGPVSANYLGHLEADIIRHYHVVEKSLAMPEFRPRSASEVVKRLLALTQEWKNNGGGLEAKQYLAALSALRSYRQRHLELAIDVGDIIKEEDILVKQDCNEDSLGGVSVPDFPDPKQHQLLESLLRSRRSVRVYREDRVPSNEDLTAAVETALSTPSVCNRQTWRVHIYRGCEAQKVIAHQNGNRGFGHAIPIVLIVTVDMRYFSEIAERYQPWIEGGLFSMSVMMALYGRGIGNVALNWSRNNTDDEALRGVAKLEPYERVIMLIGCGYPKECVSVPKSCRNDVETFIRWHGDEQQGV